jgi:undecaprenyl-diphosphatase
MSIIEAIVLGLVQGVTEFLPVSSSGHLVLLQRTFGITVPTLFFDTMLHAGTLLAVATVLWQDIWAILKRLAQPLTAFLIIATIPAVIAALAFGDAIEHAFESGNFLGLCFLVTSFILIIAEKLSRINTVNVFKKQENMNFLDVLIIGIMQAIAIIPGISRSGATISGALFRKLERDFAARFSFLLSIPAILGALVLQVKGLLKSGAAETAGENIGTAAVIAGTVIAAVVGFFAVKLMLKIIREKSLYGFAIYTAILGILILVDQAATHFVF